jgi:tight adherence protein C
MTVELLSNQNMAVLLAGFAAFAAIIGLVLPAESNMRLQARLQTVARERDRLRERRLSELTVRSKRKLRKAETGLFARALKGFGKDDSGANGGLASRLVMAGFRSPGAEAIFLFCRAAGPIAGFVCGFVFLSLAAPGTVPQSSVLPLSFACALFGYTLPRLILDRLILRRQKVILRAFPDALDLLLISVQSGMSAESALGRVTKDISSQSIELAEEFSLTMAELSYLPLRWRAYANLGERIGLPAVKLITTALVQAERHGTSIGQALTAVAREGREARIAEAERKAAALPPKLSIPLVVFFLPVLLTVILAPALMEAGDALKKNHSVLTSRRDDAAKSHPQDARSSRPSRETGVRSAP